MAELRDVGEEIKQLLHSRKAVVVDFWAEWCTPCRIVEDVLRSMSKEWDKHEVLFTRINVGEHPEVAMEFGVVNLPTVIVFRDGEEVGRFVGTSGLKNKISKILAGTP